MFKIIINILFIHLNLITTFVTNANFLITSEQQIYNKILEQNKLPCHLQTARIKSFESAIQKFKTKNLENIYDLNDLIGFRYVFYTNEDLFKFYHHLKIQKKITNTKNYIITPKENGYKAFHIKYLNEYNNCPIKKIECQLYVIDDYYNALYGNAKRKDKNYTSLYF